MHMWTWTLDQGLVYVRLVVVLSPNYLLHDVLAIAKQHENHWQGGLLSTHSPWAKWNLESVNFFFFFKKVTLYYQNSTRFFTATHTHTYIYMHIRCTSAAHIALFYFWKTELFLPNSFFSSLSFLHNVLRGTIFVNWSSSKKPFQTTQLQIVSEWVSELWVSELRVLTGARLKKKQKKTPHKSIIHSAS